jgi:hypothetical protein
LFVYFLLFLVEIASLAFGDIYLVRCYFPVIGLLLVIGSDVRADKKKPEKKLDESKPKASKGFFRKKDKPSPVEEISLPVENTGNQ